MLLYQFLYLLFEEGGFGIGSIAKDIMILLHLYITGHFIEYDSSLLILDYAHFVELFGIPIVHFDEVAVYTRRLRQDYQWNHLEALSKGNPETNVTSAALGEKIFSIAMISRDIGEMTPSTRVQDTVGLWLAQGAQPNPTFAVLRRTRGASK